MTAPSFSRLLLVCTILFGFTTQTTALSLGRAQSAVLIGRVLDIGIPVTLEPGEDVTAICSEATILYGDTRVRTEGIEWQPEGTQSRVGRIRIRSATPVDEPVVTVFFKTGCQETISRRYVFLTELAVDTQIPRLIGTGHEPTAPTPTAGTTTATSPVTVRPLAIAEPEALQKKLSATVKAGAQASEPPRPVVPQKPLPNASLLPLITSKSAQSRGQQSPRLILDPLEIASSSIPNLKLSDTLLSQSTADESRRRAAAQVWRVMRQSVEDTIKTTEQIKTLERELQSAQNSNKTQQAKLAALTSELNEAKNQAWLWPAAIAGAIALLAAVGWWMRQRWTRRSGRDWWHRPGQASDSELQGDDADVDMPLDFSASKKAHGAESLDVALNDLPASVPIESKAGGRTESGFGPASSHQEYGASLLPGLSRAVNAEELFDIQQQAEFFMTLGQYDQAIEVLSNHIKERVDTSALAYLDLFKIYHTLGYRDQYQALRVDFNEVFNAQAPDFDSFTEDDKGLEHYQAALSRIVALWPSAKVLDVIEESIFRKPGAVADAFGLEAYRELQLLYAIAKDVVQRKSAEEPVSAEIRGKNRSDTASRFMATSIQPLSAVVRASDGDETRANMIASSRVHSDARKEEDALELDIDLNERYIPEPILKHGDGAPRKITPTVISNDAGATVAGPLNIESLDFFSTQNSPDLRIVKKPK